MDMTMGPMTGWTWLLVLILFVAALVVGIVLLVRSVTDRGTALARSAESAVDILEKRFARGEIDRDEFEERRRALES